MAAVVHIYDACPVCGCAMRVCGEQRPVCAPCLEWMHRYIVRLYQGRLFREQK